MEKFCCVDNNDIIRNQNYPHSFGKETDDRNKTFRKPDKERLPSSQIKLDLNKNSDSMAFLESSSKIPISSKNVIVRKKGDPEEDYEILRVLGSG